MSEMQSPSSVKFRDSSNETVILSVEQLNLQIKQLLEGNLGQIWVQGEISNFKAHTSGHFYFSLKDSRSQVSAVMFRGSNSRLRFKPVDGLEVIVRGRISVYEPRGNYQILCETMEPVGAGALQKAFEQLRDKLKAEGLFLQERKKMIPAFPRHVAVVTSPTGAAIRDILNVLSRRAQAVKVTVVPTVVQGESAAPQIVEALKNAARLPEVDVIILGRGGGSIEDLWAFNDEILARQIAACAIPVISAVGHEIDFTISDFVADLRAPTPSAAAELVAKSSAELTQKVGHLQKMILMAMHNRQANLREKTKGLFKRLVDPRKKFRDYSIRNDDLFSRLDFSFRKLIEQRLHRVKLLSQRLGNPNEKIAARRSRLEKNQILLQRSIHVKLQKSLSSWQRLSGILDSLSPLKVVDRGYSIVLKNGQIVKSIRQAPVGTALEIQVSDGALTVEVIENKGEKHGF